MPATSGPVVPIPDFGELSAGFQARSERARGRLGVRVNSLHAFAHAEELGGATRDFLERAMSLGALPRELRLLIRMAVSSANQCRYCMAHQRHLLAGLGVAEAKVAAIAAPDSGALDPRERAAVRFAQALTLDAGAIPESVYDDFIREFTPQERIEVAVVAAAMGMLNRLNDGLRIPVESEMAALAG